MVLTGSKYLAHCRRLCLNPSTVIYLVYDEKFGDSDFIYYGKGLKIIFLSQLSQTD